MANTTTREATRRRMAARVEKISNERKKKNRPNSFSIWLMLSFLGCALVCISNYKVVLDEVGAILEAIKQEENKSFGAIPMHEKKDVKRISTETVKEDNNAQLNTKEKDVAQNDHLLSCEKFGGPEDSAAEEMVYWSDIPSDSAFVSPFKQKGEEKYLLFEPDGAGWNNKRMAMETVFALAHAMGRTLVLPPEHFIYLMSRNQRGKRNKFSCNHFFNLDALDKEHLGFSIISMKEFLERMALTGKLVGPYGNAEFPPDNRTDWDPVPHGELFDYLRRVSYWKQWNPYQCIAAFPTASNAAYVNVLNETIKEILSENKGVPKLFKYINNPTPVNATLKERLQEMLATRTELCVYDEEMQKAPVVNFLHDPQKNHRLLVNFYEFLFFEDWRHDLWMKRFIRDHIRFRNEFQCAAARVVDAIRQRAKSKNPEGNPTGSFDSFHIRRGDFAQQYGHTQITAELIYANSKNELERGSTVFIATDEQNTTFFKPLMDHYDVVFLGDFKHLFEDISSNYYSILDMLVAAKGKIFFGTHISTYTGYINRMRGYHATKHKMDGHKNGVLQSYYIFPPEAKYAMRKYYAIKKPFWVREFPVAWRDIDKGILELALEMKTRKHMV